MKGFGFNWYSLLRIAITVGCGLVASFLLRFFLNRFRARFEDDDPATRSELERRADTMVNGIQIAGNVVIILIVVVIVLKEIGIEIGPIIAALGIVGFAIGFGAQSLIKDLISGFFLIVEDQIRIGDVIAIGSSIGKVEEITIKTTRIRGKNGQLLIIPNGDIRQIVNYSRRISQLVLEISANYKPEELLEFVSGLGRDLYDGDTGRYLTEPVEISGIKSYDKGMVKIWMVFTSKLGDRDQVSSKVVPEVAQRFEKKGIAADITFQTPEGFIVS